jgi:hypothetical protein
MKINSLMRGIADHFDTKQLTHLMVFPQNIFLKKHYLKMNKIIQRQGLLLYLLLFSGLIFAQSVEITPSLSRISDTLVVKKNVGIGVDSLSSHDNRLEIKANENASFYIHDWGLDGNNILTGRFHSPTGKFPQLRFESEGNGFFDVGMTDQLGYVVEYEDDPKFWISNDNKVTIKNRLIFEGSGQSVFIGQDAGKNDDLSNNNNLYLGHLAGNANIDGENNVAIGTEAFTGGLGSYNFALGAHALQNNVNGNDNIAIGNFAGFHSEGSNNILIGSGAGESLVGTRNIIIGRELANNQTFDNKLLIDVENTAKPLIEGDFTDKTLKINGIFSASNAVGVKTDTPFSTLEVNGSMALKVKSALESGITDPDESAGTWIYTLASGAITLPNPANCPNRTYTIVNKTASSISISTYKDMLNDPQTTITSATSLVLVSDGSDWQLIK